MRPTAVVDLDTAPRLDAALQGTLAAHPSAIIVDLSQVQLLAAAGVHSLVTAAAQVTAPMSFELVAPTAHVVDRILSLLDLDTRWPIHPDTSAAIAEHAPAPVRVVSVAPAAHTPRSPGPGLGDPLG